MNISPIKDDASYRATLEEIAGLMMAVKGSPEGDRLDVLSTLVEAYEALHHSIGMPTPIEAIRFRMEQRGLGIDDLVPMIGARNRVYEVLAGRRPLTISMIRRLHAGLGIPADVLIQGAEEPEVA